MAKTKKHHMKLSTADRVFHVLNWTLLILFFIVLAYPLLYVVISSFNGRSHMLPLNLIPQGVTLEGYRAVFEYKWIWSGYLNSLVYMTLSTLLSVTVTICAAYPLSRNDFRMGGVMMALCIFTMYFSGGMIPEYLNMRNLGLMNSPLAVILPGAMNVYNMIVMRTYFKNSIPDDLREAATIDGCDEFRYLLKVVLPLSVPILAVTALFVAVNEWNSYFGPMLYLTDRNKYPLALILREILVQNTIDMTSGAINPEALAIANQRRETMKFAVIIVSSLPMLMIYPFVQKYFVKGMMIGAVKG